MSEEKKGLSGSPNDAGSAGQSEANEMPEKVERNTYLKAVGEAKALKAKLAEFQSKEVEREQQSLAEQGKWKEAAERYQNELKEHKQKLETTNKTFAKKVFQSELKALAAEAGFIPEVLDDLPKLGDWSNVEIDDDFNLNKATLKDSLNELAKAKPFLIRKQPGQVRDVNASAAGGASLKTDPSKMSKEQLLEMLRGNQ